METVAAPRARTEESEEPEVLEAEGERDADRSGPEPHRAATLLAGHERDEHRSR
jgi:hypothetical protein